MAAIFNYEQGIENEPAQEILHVDQDCKFCIDYLCIDFKKDIRKGSKRSISIAFIKTAVFLTLVCLILLGIRKVNDVQLKALKRMIPTTTPPPSGRVYSPNITDLSSRPIPSWYLSDKIGIYIEWGLHSVSGFGTTKRNSWLGNDAVEFLRNISSGSKLKYHDLAPQFTAELFEPDEWSELFAASGAKYVVLTGKRYDGYCLFPSDQSPGWNSVDVGPHRDIVGDLAKAVEKVGLKFGIHYTINEEHNALYEKDKKAEFRTSYFLRQKIWPDLKKLANTYKPAILHLEVMQFGGSVNKVYNWREEEFLAWLYSYSNVRDDILVCKAVSEHSSKTLGTVYAEINLNKGGSIFENEVVITIDHMSVGYHDDGDADDICPTKKILFQIVQAVSQGQNVLLGIGPSKEGIIPIVYQKRLLEVGVWLKRYGEAIYETHTWYQSQEYINSNIFYTCKTKEAFPEEVTDPASFWKVDCLFLKRNITITALYVIFFKWPNDKILRMRYPAYLFKEDKYQIESLDQKSKYLKWRLVQNDVFTEIEVELPNKIYLLGGNKYAWVLKITEKETLKKDSNKKKTNKTKPNQGKSRKNVKTTKLPLVVGPLAA